MPTASPTTSRWTRLRTAASRGDGGLLDKAVYAPVQGRFKVHDRRSYMLTGHAFNAMLKTLEEPPRHVKFILATTDPQKIR